MKKISVLINARIKSSRTNKKLIRPYNNSTLIDIALEKLSKLDFFDYRFLAAADEQLINKINYYNNIELLNRKNQSVEPGPHHPLITFEHYKNIPTDYFFVMNPCSSFLSIETIKRAYEVFQNTSYNSYISVEKSRDWYFAETGEALTHKKSSALQNTSDGDFYFRATHSFYIANKNFFLENQGMLWTLTQNDPFLIEIPSIEGIDVDTDTDFEISEFLYSKF